MDSSTEAPSAIDSQAVAPASQEPETVSTEEPLQTGPMAILASTHALNDSYTAFLSNLLPLLMDRFGLSYALAGLLQSALSFSTSVAQPIFGYFTDRSKRVLFIILGPAVTAIAISAMGLMPSYYWLFPALVIGGLSTAAFHPQATSVVPLVGGSRRGVAMALFIAGGTVGYAIGPMFILGIVGLWGLDATWLAAIPTVIVVALAYKYVPKTAEGFAKRAVQQASSSALMRHWKPLLLMWVIVVLRSIVATTLTGYLPTYLHDVRGFQVGFWTALAHMVFTATGAVGGLVAGHLSDDSSRRSVITFALLLATPVLLGLLHLPGLWIWPMLVLSGGLLQSTNPVLVIMAQELVPGSGGTVAGVMMGLGWAVGALVVPVVGVLADSFSLTTALSLTVTLLLVAVVLARFVPEPRKLHRQKRVGGRALSNSQ